MNTDEEDYVRQVKYIIERQKYFQKEGKKLRIKKFLHILTKKDVEHAQKLVEEQQKVYAMAKEIFKRVYGIQALEAFERAYKEKMMKRRNADDLK